MAHNSYRLITSTARQFVTSTIGKHVTRQQQTGTSLQTRCPGKLNGNAPIQTRPRQQQTGTPLQTWCPGNSKRERTSTNTAPATANGYAVTNMVSRQQQTGTHQYKLAWQLQTGTTDKLRYPATANGYTVTTPVHHIKMALPQHCSSNTAAMYTWPSQKQTPGAKRIHHTAYQGRHE